VYSVWAFCTHAVRTFLSLENEDIDLQQVSGTGRSKGYHANLVYFKDII